MKKFILFPVYGLLLAGFLLASLFGVNLHTWHRLTDESPIAELTFSRTGPREYEAAIAYGDFCTEEKYRLHGEQWRLDAQFLKWHPWANLLGFDAMYRIERLGGRYLAILDEQSAPREVYDLHNPDVPDLTEILGRYGGRFSPVDTLYGSSVYARMDEQHIFRVYRGQSGLVLRKVPRVAASGARSGITIPINTTCPDAKNKNNK